MGIKQFSIPKRVFFMENTAHSTLRSREIWGREKAAQLKSIQLGYFKRLFGLHRITHSQFLNGDLGIWPLINYRLVSVTSL